MKRNVTEADFRIPEFRDAKVEDYEFRDDDKLVRKDRWEQGIRRIATCFGITRDFEIDDLVLWVRAIVDENPTAWPEGMKIKKDCLSDDLYVTVGESSEQTVANGILFGEINPVWHILNAIWESQPDD